MRLRAIYVAILGFVPWLGGCTDGLGPSPEVIRIGYQKAGTLNLLRLRRELEPDLAKLGLRAEWVGFPAGPQLLEALNAGVVDFGHAGDAPPILAQSAGVPFLYVAQEPSRPHSEAIIVPPGSPLKTLADLEGKRVALNKGSNVHFLLVRALGSAGVPYDRVQVVFLAPSDARAAFEGGSIDAWATWDPYFAEAELRAGARILADAEGLSANREFHLASRRLASERPDAVRAIVAALDREGRWAKEHKDEVAKLLADELGLDEAVMRRVVERKSYGIAAMDETAVAEQQRVADAFLAQGLIPGPIGVREAVADNLAGR